jgi:hypothetical protein
VNVGEDAGGDAANPAPVAQVDLTIEPGVTIYAEDSVSALFVQRGSRLFADGTRQAPIIMTSKTDLDGTVVANSRNQWGGLVINGRAPINACSNTALTGGDANCEKSGEGNSGLFGGNDINDDSGRLSYVRVMYPGQILSGTNELNGIAFQGVGQMDVDYVQVHNSGDDGVEFFGGNVSVKHLIITGAEDDSVDWTDGWTGNVQYAIVVQSNGANRSIEADSREGAPDRTPRSAPKFSNFTFVGLNAGGENDGIKLRRGTEATMLNGIVTNFALDGLDFDDDSALAADPVVDSTLFAANGVNVEAAAAGIFAAGANNVDSPTISLATGTGATQALVLTAPAVTPTNANTAIGSFFDNTAYVGAVEDANDDWYLGWTFGL